MLSAFAAKALGVTFIGAVSLIAAGANAITPDRSWLGVKRLAVLADLRVANPGDEALKNDFCATVKRLAERDAPIPVDCIPPNTAPAPEGGTVVLVAQAAIQERDPSQRLLVFTVRKDRDAGLEPGPVFFGAAPRAVPLTGSAADQSALEGALAASLGEVLPWLRPTGSLEFSPIR